MISTPQRRNGASTSSTPQRVRLKGLFSDGVWHCNCTPRLPASHFQVKKEGPNKGRWFFTCQQPKDNSCGFFLWAEEAAPREMRAVIGNARSEVEDRLPREDPLTSDNGVAEGVNWMKTEDEEFGEWPLSSIDESKADEGAEQQANVPGAYPQTPRKAVKTSSFATPGSKRKREEDMLPTPVTGANKYANPNPNLPHNDIFNIPSTGPTPTNHFLGMRSPSKTPTPARFRDPIEPTDSNSDHTKPSYDISAEVMSLLADADQNLDESAIADLQEFFARHAARISGIVKGRDITRVALKAKDAKIAELQQKISALEAEREMDKSVIRHFKSDMASSIAKRGNRGSGKGRYV